MPSLHVSVDYSNGSKLTRGGNMVHLNCMTCCCPVLPFIYWLCAVVLLVPCG
jgi:hypothetical protein